MCGIRGMIFGGISILLEVVFNSLVPLRLKGTDTLMYFSFIPIESREISKVFPPEPATT